MTSPLDVHTDGPVQIWTIALPDVGNAITGKTRTTLDGNEATSDWTARRK